MTRKPKLGQHFLVDDRARHAIADGLGDMRERTVIEIGPGHGAITSILAERCKRLIAIEFDPALAAELRFRYREQPQVEIVEADVLQVDLAALVPDGETADVIGNLPYYITSEILLRLYAAGAREKLARAVLMMQREVADRLAAAPGVRDYGLLSATTQMYARVEAMFTLPPAAFSPPPDVWRRSPRLRYVPQAGLCPEAKDAGEQSSRRWLFAGRIACRLAGRHRGAGSGRGDRAGADGVPVSRSWARLNYFGPCAGAGADRGAAGAERGV
jgi:16S rRNA (adenine1518-N6/adenine1519-N6)-dimethyltransferase